MQQKITWTRYLIIGINAALLNFNGCKCDDCDERIQHAEYVYVNKSNELLRFELYDSYYKSSIEYQLQKTDSIKFLVSETPIAFPFADNEVSYRTGDSLVIRFGSNRCVHYARNSHSGTFNGTGVFNLEEYENYSQNLVSQRKYRLVYWIDEKDIDRAVDCN